MSFFGLGGSSRSKAAAFLEEVAPLCHPDRVKRLIALGTKSRSDKAARDLLDELWRMDGDGAAYTRRLVLKSCYGSRDGARVLAALSDPSRLVRGGARKLIALCCSDEQAAQALQTMWYVRQHLPVLQALRKRGRTAPVDQFLDWLHAQSGDTRIADCIPYGSEAAIRRHLQTALLRPSTYFWEALLTQAPTLLATYLTDELRAGSGRPDARLQWVIDRSLARLARRCAGLTVSLCDALLGRGTQPPSDLWPTLARQAPDQTCDVALRHRLTLPGGSFEKWALRLDSARRAALVRHDPWALGSPAVWFRHLPVDDRRAVVAAWLDIGHQHPRWGTPILRALTEDRDLGTDATVDAVYARWSAAAQNQDGIIDIEQVRRLPENLALREARRHLSTVTQLQTRPRQRLPYARFLGWDEAQATLKAYIGHPEGETRGHALAILLALAGHTRDDAQRAARVEEALRMVRARKNEQDPVRAAMLQALVDWPRAAWSARNLPDVAQILRDALDAADLSHGTAQLAERLVVRLFRLDGEWGAKWFATLVKERGTIYAPRLGDQLTDSDVRALGTTLLDVARAWATREREAQLVQLAASLKGRLTWVAGLMDLLERVVRDSATAATSLALMALIEHDDRPRFDAMIGDVCRNWLARRWESSLINLTQGLRRGTVPAPLAAAMEEALQRTSHEHQAATILAALALRAPVDFRAVVPRAVARDLSFVCLPVVYEFLHRQRQDLLGPCLGDSVVTGRFATGKTRWLLPFSDGFFRWTPQQQALYARQLTRITHDGDRDSPTVFWALVRIPELQFVAPTDLFTLADDGRAAVREKAVRTLGRCDAGQGVPKLLSCLEDARARYAIYALRRALLELPPAPALALLKKVPMGKVTVAKEVVRLLGELRSDAAFQALLALDSPTLHRDIRIALLRALWDHLEREETWQFLRRAATGSDWILAARVGDIPPDRLTAEVDRRLSEVMALVVDRPEPEARLDLLQRAPGLPMKDLDRLFVRACMARLNSRFHDEVGAALRAVEARAAEGDVDAIAAALRSVRDNRRALADICARVVGALPPQTAVGRSIAVALLQALADDSTATALYVGTALRIYALPLQVDRCLATLRDVHRQGRLHGVALGAAQAALRQLVVPQIPLADLENLLTQLVQSNEEELRVLGVAVLATLTAPKQGQGWTAARRALLLRLCQDPAAVVAEAAQFTFPPLEEGSAGKDGRISQA